MSAEQAWRTVNLVPACVGFCTGILNIMIADDAPKGKYKEMKQWGTMAEVCSSILPVRRHEHQLMVIVHPICLLLRG
jgi:intracellular septation protein A